MSLKSVAKKYRKPETDVHSIFYTRWSPRSMNGERMSRKDLMPLFEAAKWAPSSFNGQPWRFSVALRGDKNNWDIFFGFLNEWNQKWCKNASALVIIFSKNNFEYNNEENQHHSFDTGAAWGYLALEGARRGLVVHGIGGFNSEMVSKVLKVPKDYKVEMMCAIGKLGKKSDLPGDMEKREVPNGRKKLKEIVSFGIFNWK